MSDFVETLGECLTDSQREHYDEFARRLRKIESSDYVYGEQSYHQQSLDDVWALIREGAEGVDLLGAMVVDHRRKRDLCAAEIRRRERAGAYPPSGKMFIDYSDAKRQIKDRTVEVIDSYTHLQKHGKEYRGLCLFHADHHPSLRVNPQKGLWHCDVCGTGGDVFDFVARAEKLNDVN